LNVIFACWLVVGCWLLVVGCWLLVVGCWVLAIKKLLSKQTSISRCRL